MEFEQFVRIKFGNLNLSNSKTGKPIDESNHWLLPAMEPILSQNSMNMKNNMSTDHICNVNLNLITIELIKV